jgi:hypothetical protein
MISAREKLLARKKTTAPVVEPIVAVSSASIVAPTQPAKPPSTLPPAELCDICDGSIRWESVYRDRTWRCAECEPWPNRSLVGCLINLGSFSAEQGGPAWLDASTGERIDPDALGVAVGAKANQPAADSWFDKLQLVERFDQYRVVHRRWILPGLKMITFEIGISDDGRQIPFSVGGNGIVGTKFPKRETKIPSDEICSKKPTTAK